MKIIGLIGGMSWESTIPYYRHINQIVKARLGGLHSAKIILFSVDFAQIEALQQSGDWHAAGEILAQAARALTAAGADLLVLCTNTMHKVADQISAATPLPLLHIADATALDIQQTGLSKVGFLGTQFTMEQDFYLGRLRKQHQLEVLLPNAEDRQRVHQIIYQELCQGQINDASRTIYRQIIQKLVDAGAQGIILGCTEIGLLVQPQDASVPLFDTAYLHARQAAEWALR
jgi:aspartate racemase